MSITTDKKEMTTTQKRHRATIGKVSLSPRSQQHLISNSINLILSSIQSALANQIEVVGSPQLRMSRFDEEVVEYELTFTLRRRAAK
jgi:hypothetical protein